MRALRKAIFFILLMASMAACASTSSNNNDSSSSDPQVRYGGQMTIRGQASKGTNQ